LLAPSFTDLRHSLPHFDATNNFLKSRMKKIKIHSKGHFGYLYCSFKVESGDTWRTTQLLRHMGPKKSTPIIRFTDISLLHMGLRLTS
jgi:hypothetical protein